MVTMEREASHHQASCTTASTLHHGTDFRKQPPNFVPTNYVSPRTSHIQRNLSEFSLSDLLQLAKQLKYPCITTLRLSVSAEDQLSVSQFFGAADQRSTDTLFAFTRALAHAVEGWMQNLELGVCLGLRDINTLCPAIRSSRTLKHLSFANSGLGDVTLQVLSSCLQNCQPLQTLNLSGCALTDASSAVIAAIIKGVDPNSRSAQQSPRKTSRGKHRAPKYGQQWRQNAILIGKWSPAPELGDNLITPRADVGDWQATLRKPVAVGVVRHETKPAKLTNTSRLVALDLSCNSFTDALSKELCPLLYKRPPLFALNLRCNKMTRAGAKPLLDVMKEINILSLVDIRGNTDDSSLGVLENGEHYTTFSTLQSPFWMHPESLDPIINDTEKSQSTTPARCMPEKQQQQTKATILRGGSSPHNCSSNKTGLSTITPSQRTKTPSKGNSSTSPSCANMSPSCSGASVSRTCTNQAGPGSYQRRYHSSHNEDMMELNEGHINRKYISAPGKERPLSSARTSPLRSTWPEKTSFCDQTSQKYISPLHDQDLDARFTTLSLPQEHPIWDHGFDTRVPIHSTSNEGPKRAQSANYNVHLPRYYHHHHNYNHHDFYNKREYGISPYRPSTTFSASNSPSRLRSWGPPTIYNQGAASPRCVSRGGKSQSPVISYHHQCKLLKDVKEQKRSRSVREDSYGHMMMPRVFHQLLPNSKVASLPDDKKELVEWNTFVNQMTTTLLNLKDGLDQLIGPTEGAVAQQATTKLNQMPSTFFRSGMLRLLERSCKVLNSHVMSLTKRHKDNVRHMNVGTENQAPAVNGETLVPSMKKKKAASKVSISQDALLAKQENIQFEKGLNVEKVNVKHLGVHGQHRMIYHSNLPPLMASKGINNVPQATQ